MELKNLKRYVPENMPMGEWVQYYIDESGLDWHKSLDQFTKPYVITYDSATGIIHSASSDASALYPVGLNVLDVDSLPDGFDIRDIWFYKDGAITRDYASLAERSRDELVSSAEGKIADWLVDLRLDMLSKEGKDELILWRQYIKSLKSLDLTEVIDENTYNSFVWPPQP